MMKKIASEPLLALIALLLTVVLLITRDLSMSATTQNMLLAFFTVAVLAYSTFIYHERPADEREYELSLVASKHAYVIGSAIMSVGIVVKVIDHTLDVWLPITLAAMVITKTLSYFIHNK
jgi:hypothetical protein